MNRTRMKKALLALAIGTAFAAPTAHSDVTLSGSINAGPAYLHQGEGSSASSNSIRTAPATAPAAATRTGINANYSNITIGSMEDLGGGLKLDFAYQITATAISAWWVIAGVACGGVRTKTCTSATCTQPIRWTARLVWAATCRCSVLRVTEWCSMHRMAARQVAVPAAQ